MLAAIGMFAFEMDSALYDALTRRREWRNVRTERFGALPASQFVGPGDDKITLSGTLIPELAGSYSAITTIAAMAGAGEAYPFTLGSGAVLGNYTIDSLEEQHSNIIDNGLARKIDFTIELTRVS